MNHYALNCLTAAMFAGISLMIVLKAIFIGITPQLAGNVVIQVGIFIFFYKVNPVFRDIVDNLKNKIRGDGE
ncbi:hypothetical protein PPK15_gp88 [Bacillus phage 000TH010]|uniref:Uncharacterized protein n=1 Tax=Bacillus phage 000TH010 TaxID=2601652 RepID=A0A5P8PHX2_9CAUD|nr:hypothetical protein PPK15_gp88 [Bacillus phage 000TH010]QFR56301.1 hypothetical protein 000TH010_88 [Bacillus phage 000TH010]